MDTAHLMGLYKAYLHNEGLSAFPDEQEYLLGNTFWIVTSIKPKVRKQLGSKTFEVTEIYLESDWL